VRFFRWVNPEIALGFLVATVFWVAVLGWETADSLTEKQKQECYEAAKASGHKAEECKTLWERTTSDPVAFFTFVLSVSTIGLWIVTWRAGTRQARDMESSIAVAKESADTARLAADAAIAAERARIQIAITYETFEDIYKCAMQWPNSPDMALNRPGMAVKYEIVNLGRTPAIIHSIKHGLAAAPAPVDPEYVDWLGNEGDVITPNEKIKDVLCFGKIEVATVADALVYLYGEKHFWFFVDILYEDIFDVPHHKRAYSRFVIGRGGNGGEWLPTDYKDYNKST
jgi:hypothetical protein